MLKDQFQKRCLCESFNKYLCRKVIDYLRAQDRVAAIVKKDDML